jgi:hypothetical protein
MRDLLPEEPRLPARFDLLIVDEAHNVAPAVRQHYAVPTPAHAGDPRPRCRTSSTSCSSPRPRTTAIRRASPRSSTSSTTAASRSACPRSTRRCSRRSWSAASRSDLATDALGRRRFARRVLAAIEVDYADDERRIHRALGEYAELRLAGTRAETEQFAAEFVLKLLKKRLFSSPEAFKLTLERHIRR